jgi:hypothetical protein
MKPGAMLSEEDYSTCDVVMTGCLHLDCPVCEPPKQVPSRRKTHRPPSLFWAYFGALVLLLLLHSIKTVATEFLCHLLGLK